MAWQRLIELVEQEKFEISEKISCGLEYIVAKDEGLVPEVIRDGTVSVSSGNFGFNPPEAHELQSILVQTFEDAQNDTIFTCDRGYKLALDFAYNQFYWEGVKQHPKPLKI